MPLKLKTVEVNGSTYAEVKDGKPVFLDDANKEVAFDAEHSVTTISRLNGEAKSHREGKEAAEAKLKAFEGIKDPAAALKAIETVGNLEAGKLVEAGKVEEMKAGIIKAEQDKWAGEKKSYEDKVADLTANLGKSETAYFTEKVGGAFARSGFIKDKTILPPEVAQATFGSRFKIEDGKIVGLDLNGQPIYSKSKAGATADFEEAIEVMIDSHASRDALLKGTGSGSGSQGGNGGGNSGKSMSRSEFDKLDPMTRATKMREGFTLTDG